MSELTIFKPCRDGDHWFCTGVKVTDDQTVRCSCSCGHPEEGRAQQNLFPRQLTLALVLQKVSAATAIAEIQIASPTKGPKPTWAARNLFYQVARLCEFTTLEIGAWMQRDHSTVVQCSQRITDTNLAQILYRELMATTSGASIIVEQR